MKYIYKIFLLTLSATTFFACSDDKDLKVVNKGVSPVLSSDVVTTFDLDSITDATAIGNFTWTEATYSGAPHTFKYDVNLIAQDTSGRATYPSLIKSTDLSLAITGEMINGLFANKKLDLNEFVDNTLSFKVDSFLGTSGLAQASNVVTISFLARTEIIQPKFETFVLVGDATIGSEWDENSGLQPLFKSSLASTEYTFSGKFNAGEFKVLGETGKWQPQYGDSAGALGFAAAEGDDEPSNFKIDAEGYYKFTMNTVDMTYTIDEISEPNKYPTIGIIGSATPGGWDSDTDLYTSAFDSHIWYLSDLALEVGEVKFRANDGWDVNWGTASAGYGFGTPGGDNIPVAEAGTYDVIFNDITGGYILIKK